MFDRREKNIEVFENSVSMMKNNIKLKQSVTDSIRRQTVYLEPDTIAIPENQNLNCKTVISQKRSFEAASEYAREGKKVCVLNFASATNPGGGVTRGSTAQEECLCRCSTLFDFCGKKFFSFGGASSHDVDDGILDPEDYESRSEFKKVVKEWQKENKMFRIKGVSWWERELPTEEEMNFGKEMLAANNNQVDFIISHCCPQQVAAVFSCGLYKADRLTSYFDEIMENTKFIRWYFGHYHDDRVILGKFVMLYHSFQRVV